jgi:quercetin dioxygenase-like cupin family protein
MELWFVPRGEVIPTHSHPDMDGVIVPLLGRMVWTRGNKSRAVRGPSLTAYDVGRGVMHSAIALTAAVFVVFERWHINPTSAAINIEF